MEQYKQVIFTPRITTFHHTMAPAGGTSATRPTLSAVWHEEVSGRMAKDIASVVYIMIKDSPLREKTSLTLWLDNCAPQNKNYTFFTMLLSLINSDIVDLNVLTLKFFESGHTFMAADSVHAGVEKQILKAKNVLDISHFADCVRQATSNTMVMQPRPADFLNFQPHYSRRRLSEVRPRLAELSVVEFRRGSNVLHVKRKFGEEFSDFNYLQKKVQRRGLVDIESIEPSRPGKRGIPQSKKDNIIRDIVPLIRVIEEGRHARRARFFEKLSVSDGVADLLVDNDDDEAAEDD